MKNPDNAKGSQLNTSKTKDGNGSPKNHAETSRHFVKGNPNRKEGHNIKSEQKKGPSADISNDQQSAQEIKQALKDDQALAAVASDIGVTVKDGAVTLDGVVSNEQQMNLANNTAAAVGMVDQLKNRIKLKKKDKRRSA